jgi:hypothetical protein
LFSLQCVHSLLRWARTIRLLADFSFITTSRDEPGAVLESRTAATDTATLVGVGVAIAVVLLVAAVVAAWLIASRRKAIVSTRAGAE